MPCPYTTGAGNKLTTQILERSQDFTRWAFASAPPS